MKFQIESCDYRYDINQTNLTMIEEYRKGALPSVETTYTLLTLLCKIGKHKAYSVEWVGELSTIFVVKLNKAVAAT